LLKIKLNEKPEKQETESIDLLDLATEQIENDDEFWNSIRELARFGVPAYDKKGHWTEIRVRVRPLQRDMVGAIREKLPDNWYKSQAQLYRSIIAVGCKTFLKLLNMGEDDWMVVLEGLNKIARQTRMEEFKAEMSILKQDIVNGTMESDEKVKVIDLVEKLQKRIVGM
jgi:hypothetical protein